MKLKKIILLSVLAIVLIAVIYIAYVMLTTRSHSPADQMVYTDGDFELTVNYCRPFKKERLIFGEEKDGALVPYETYWRTGANDATEITFNQDIMIVGNSLPAGNYRLYTIPGEESWTIAFNSEVGEWGYSEPDYEQDVLRSQVPSIRLEEPVEQFTIRSEKSKESTMHVILEWDRTQVRIPINY